MPIEPGRRSDPRIRLWSLREDVLVEGEPQDDRLVVVTRWGETKIDDAGEMVWESLRRMSLGPVSLDNVLGPRDGSPADVARLESVLLRLSDSVVHSLGTRTGEGPMLSAVPIARSARFAFADVDTALPVRLSRFAALRTADGDLVVESPLADYRVVLHRRIASRVVVGLSAATSVDALTTALGFEPALVGDIVSFMTAAGIVLLGEWADGATATVPRFVEDTDPKLVNWSHHDLLFHSRTRLGRYGGLSGVLFPTAQTMPPPPLVKQLAGGVRYPLFHPDLSRLMAADPTMTEVIENTRLCHELSDRPVTAEQVGELLFRAARVRSVSSASAGGEVTYEISERPYLSVHGLYELEIYLLLHNCTGLPRGIFHFDPREHSLTLVNDDAGELDEVLDYAMIGSATTQRPPAMITVTARAERSSWMYGGIAYSLTLTHVGALQQTLCLAATAMGLTACVPAIDPGDVVDSALRLEWPAEIGVGEFAFGYRRQTAEHRQWHPPSR
ncbi:SagB-type dehydrogenase domain-containing protein [Actinokineospora alba]|uniref:SagB-type dehydrogenase domain-containing protein n=1 Tax=Actinokineospora alba TaxID=504798 RepID=A0A1H0W7M6_9PSEU|nr:SagB family peptide dehydrogenase [Actinokineospora alba]TDP70011.1 SagB-type dehydrogenase family enzyme [Actinokineospora alba]SDJ49947.1 SagB-type dehydrogenase domain-containing protein [Actinokineospora alba]SDP86481.1 SagB-type dehydrogenase domain-containing protein [Actinokineospora alba]